MKIKNKKKCMKHRTSKSLGFATNIKKGSQCPYLLRWRAISRRGLGYSGKINLKSRKKT